MDPFSTHIPEWTEPAVHALQFSCPQCQSSPLEAQRVCINRHAPVYSEDYRRKWQEFYQCACGVAWWAWSCDRPPSELASRKLETDAQDLEPSMEELLDLGSLILNLDIPPLVNPVLQEDLQEEGNPEEGNPEEGNPEESNPDRPH